MSNSHTQFSTCIVIDKSQGQQAMTSIALTLGYWKDQPYNEDMEPRVSAYVKGPHVWVTYEHEEDGDVELACLIIEKLVEDLRMDRAVSLQYSQTCSKHLPDGFGGGAIVVKRGQETKWINTHQWVQDNI